MPRNSRVANLRAGNRPGKMTDAREGVIDAMDEGGARERRRNGPPDFCQSIEKELSNVESPAA